jgi:hypothetical protein
LIKLIKNYQESNQIIEEESNSKIKLKEYFVNGYNKYFKNNRNEEN